MISIFYHCFFTVKFLRPDRVIVELDKDSHVAVVSWQMTQNISCERGLQETVYWCTVDKNQGNQSYALCQVNILYCWHNPKNEPPHGKTNNLHRRKQRRRSASR